MNHQWSKNASKLIEKFKSQESLTHLKKPEDKHTKNFIRCASEFPKFDYELFLNKESQSLSVVIYFGTHVEGPPEMVHGGAIATMIDACFGILLWRLDMYCVTVNLNVNYKKFIPLNTEVQFHGCVEKVEGRKIYVKGEIRSLDGSVVHDDGTGIFVTVEKKK